MMFSRKILLLTAMLLGLSTVARAEESATLLRASALRAKPYLDSAVVDQLDADSQLTVVRKKGVWVEVRTLGGQEGWLKALSLKYANPANNTVNSRPGRFSILKTGSSGVTATTGVKGWQEGAETKPAPAPADEAGNGQTPPPPAKQEPANQVLDLLKGLKSLGGD